MMHRFTDRHIHNMLCTLSVIHSGMVVVLRPVTLLSVLVLQGGGGDMKNWISGGRGGMNFFPSYFIGIDRENSYH